MATSPPAVAVVGVGRMGSGIGFALSRTGADLWFLVRDVHRAAATLADAVIGLQKLDWFGEGGPPRYAVVDRVAALPPCYLVVESVPENHSLKAEVLARVSAAQPEAIVGSNTSSLLITDLAASVLRPERFIGMHFWYPPTLMPLVEIIPGEATAEKTVVRCEAVLRSCGKVPLRLRRDYPGFLWNRIQIAVLREAKHLVDQGVADAATVDLVVQHGLARRWAVTGPLASAVLGGLDTFEAVGRNLLPLLSAAESLDGLAELLKSYVADPEALDAYRNERLAAMPGGPDVGPGRGG